MVNLEEKVSILENRVNVLEKELESLLSKISVNNFNHTDPSNEIPRNIIKNIEHIPTRDLVLMLLRMNPNQTINQLEIHLKKIGWIKDSFFKKNFGTALTKKGLIQPSEKNTGKKDIFALTLKGEFIADNILERLNNKFKN